MINNPAVSAQPNFEDGEEITFGYARGAIDGGRYEISHGIDNWTVTIHRVP